MVNENATSVCHKLTLSNYIYAVTSGLLVPIAHCTLQLIVGYITVMVDSVIHRHTAIYVRLNCDRGLCVMWSQLFAHRDLQIARIQFVLICSIIELCS